MITKRNTSGQYLQDWGVAYASALLLVVVILTAPGIARANENFFQIINDRAPAVIEDYIQDRGYSVYVSYDGKKFLMDAGMTKRSFVNNLNVAGIRLDDLDFVFMSHRHWDHTTGWTSVSSNYLSLRRYLPPGGGFSPIRKNDVVVNDHIEISPNVILMHTHDDAGSAGITDELSLLIKTKKGTYLFTSNSHTDFFAKLKKAKLLTGQDVYFHSGHTARRVTKEETIRDHAKKMKALNISKVSPSHSKSSHDKIFEEIFGTDYVAARLGQKIPLD